MRWLEYLVKPRMAWAPPPNPQPASRGRISSSTFKRPLHIAIVADGHGRWAAARGEPRSSGPRQGVETVREVVKGCLEHQIQVLSLFAFSAQNWNRPQEEIQESMDLLRRCLEQETARLREEGVRIRMMGRRNRIPQDVLEAFEQAESVEIGQPRMILNLGIDYGGREELTHAIQRLARDIAEGQVNADSVNESVFSKYLMSGALPAVDLLIRTAGAQRLSNFMLWQSAYAELFFTDTPWAEFTRKHLDAALADFGARRRTFGGLVDLGASAQRKNATA